MKTIFLIANGGRHLSTNRANQPAQAESEGRLAAALEAEGWSLERAVPFDESKGHGFIDSQSMGIEIFRSLPREAPILVVVSSEQCAHHLLPGLLTHRGPVLLVCALDAALPSIPSLLGLNGVLARSGIKASALWSEDFADEFFLDGLRKWLKKGRIKAESRHVLPFEDFAMPAFVESIGIEFAKSLKKQKAILGVFEGESDSLPMPDEPLNTRGVFIERAGLAALLAEMQEINDDEARGIYEWFWRSGVKFQLGPDDANSLTDRQVLRQCAMYVAATRIADRLGCAAIGLPLHRGRAALLPAPGIVASALNSLDRPPVFSTDGRELFPGGAPVHFSTGDECAALDALVTHNLWQEQDLAPETSQYELRWCRQCPVGGLSAFVWTLASTSPPPAHLVGGWSGTTGQRVDPSDFPVGGSAAVGVGKPGWMVWSRIFLEEGRLKFDTGLGECIELPDDEAAGQPPQIPSHVSAIHAVFQGISRDQMLGHHKSATVQVALAPDRASAKKALQAKASAMNHLGIEVCVCGKV